MARHFVIYHEIVPGFWDSAGLTTFREEKNLSRHRKIADNSASEQIDGCACRFYFTGKNDLCEIYGTLTLVFSSNFMKNLTGEYKQSKYK